MADKKELNNESMDQVAGGLGNVNVKNKVKTNVKQGTKEQQISGQNDNQGIQGTNTGDKNQNAGVGGNVDGGIKMG